MYYSTNTISNLFRNNLILLSRRFPNRETHIGAVHRECRRETLNEWYWLFPYGKSFRRPLQRSVCPLQFPRSVRFSAGRWITGYRVISVTVRGWNRNGWTYLRWCFRVFWVSFPQERPPERQSDLVFNPPPAISTHLINEILYSRDGD